MSSYAVDSTLQDIYHPVREDLLRMDEVIRRRLSSDVSLIDQVSSYILSSGGKRLRPTLLLLVARACGHKGTSQYDLAAAIEFVHTATLLHDDVVDTSEVRRGRKTSNLKFGNPTAVLVGDFLYSRAFLAMVEVGMLEALGVLAETTNVIAEGEILQLTHCGNADLTVADYLQVVHQKTAKLFEAAARMGALLKDPHLSSCNVDLGAYGLAIGTAFQIMDDVLDYSGNEATMGKKLGDDLREGKVTLPLIYALEGADAKTSQRIRLAIHDGLKDGDEALILKTIAETGSAARASRLAVVESRRAVEILHPLPESEFKESLIALAHFAADRSF